MQRNDEQVKQCTRCYQWYNGTEKSRLCEGCLDREAELNEMNDRLRMGDY